MLSSIESYAGKIDQAKALFWSIENYDRKVDLANEENRRIYHGIKLLSAITQHRGVGTGGALAPPPIISEPPQIFF